MSSPSTKADQKGSKTPVVKTQLTKEKDPEYYTCKDIRTAEIVIKFSDGTEQRFSYNELEKLSLIADKKKGVGRRALDSISNGAGKLSRKLSSLFE